MKLIRRLSLLCRSTAELYHELAVSALRLVPGRS